MVLHSLVKEGLDTNVKCLEDEKGHHSSWWITTLGDIPGDNSIQRTISQETSDKCCIVYIRVYVVIIIIKLTIEIIYQKICIKADHSKENTSIQQLDNPKVTSLLN